MFVNVLKISTAQPYQQNTSIYKNGYKELKTIGIEMKIETKHQLKIKFHLEHDANKRSALKH